MATAAVVALTAGCAQVPPGTPPVTATPTPTASPQQEFGPQDLVVRTGRAKTPLSVRHVPSTDGNVLARIPDGTTITVPCRVDGELISGSQGDTGSWDRVTYRGHVGFVSAAYVEGGAGRAVGPCPGRVPAIVDEPLPLPKTLPKDRGKRIVSVARSQLGVAEGSRDCNPYGPCTRWSAFYAAWVWREAGVQAPGFWLTGELYRWGQNRDRAHPGTDGVGPGDLVFHGTGPGTSQTSVHVDVVIAVEGDRLRVIGGNVHDRVTERRITTDGLYGWLDA